MDHRVKTHPPPPRVLSTNWVAWLGTCNVRTLLLTDNNGRLVGNSIPILVQQVRRLKWDVIGLAETHLTGTEEYVGHFESQVGQTTIIQLMLLLAVVRSR